MYFCQMFINWIRRLFYQSLLCLHSHKASKNEHHKIYNPYDYIHHPSKLIFYKLDINYNHSSLKVLNNYLQIITPLRIIYMFVLHDKKFNTSYINVNSILDRPTLYYFHQFSHFFQRNLYIHQLNTFDITFHSLQEKSPLNLESFFNITLHHQSKFSNLIMKSLNHILDILHFKLLITY